MTSEGRKSDASKLVTNAHDQCRSSPLRTILLRATPINPVYYAYHSDAVIRQIAPSLLAAFDYQPLDLKYSMCHPKILLPAGRECTTSLNHAVLLEPIASGCTLTSSNALPCTGEHNLFVYFILYSLMIPLVAHSPITQATSLARDLTPVFDLHYGPAGTSMGIREQGCHGFESVF